MRWITNPERLGSHSLLIGGRLFILRYGAIVCAALLVAQPKDVQAGAWTLKGGRLWLKQSVSFWQTSRKFASSLDTQLNFPGRGPVRRGERIPFDPSTGGRVRALGLTTDVWLGLVDRLQVGISLPLLWSDFDTKPVDTVDDRFGLGDVWFFTQGSLPVYPAMLGTRIDVKVPSGKFDPSVFSAPLTEGQVDLGLFVLAGIPLGTFGYANTDFGWRFRFENQSNQRDPGDELRFSIEAGLNLPYRFMLKLVADGLVGFPGTASQFGIRQELPRRRLYSLWTGLLWQATKRLTFEFDARFLLAGENFPSGVQFLLSGAYRFSLWQPASASKRPS